MTRESLVNSNFYTGTGATDTYSYTWYAESESVIKVEKETISTGAVATLVLTTDYTVTATQIKAGSTIVLTAGNLTTDEKISIKRVPALDQTTDIRNQGPRFQASTEDEFDKRADIDQYLNERIDGCVKLPGATDPSTVSMTLPVPVADQYIKFSSDALSLELAAIVAGSNISLPAGLAFMAQTASGVFTARTITKSGNIVVTNGDGQSGDPVIDSSAIDTSIATNVSDIAARTTTADHASTANAKGASLIGVEDSAAQLDGADAEAALAELALREPKILTFSRATNVSGAQSTAHGMTAIPKEAQVYAVITGGATDGFSTGKYIAKRDNTGAVQACVVQNNDGLGTGFHTAINGSVVSHIDTDTSKKFEGVLSFTDTNAVMTWTITGVPATVTLDIILVMWG